MRLPKITVKLTSPRDYEITKDGVIMVVRANRILDDEALGKPLREYEEILRFAENFEVRNVKPNYNFLIKSTEEQHPIKTITNEGFIKTQKEEEVDIIFNQVVTEGIKNTTLSDKLLPSSEDISRIEDKYNHSMNKVNPKYTADDIAHEITRIDRTNLKELKPIESLIPHIAGIPNPIKRQEMIIRNLKEFTSDDIVEFFGKMGYDRHRINNNVSHDIKALKQKNRIRLIDSNPRKYSVIIQNKSTRVDKSPNAGFVYE